MARIETPDDLIRALVPEFPDHLLPEIPAIKAGCWEYFESLSPRLSDEDRVREVRLLLYEVFDPALARRLRLKDLAQSVCLFLVGSVFWALVFVIVFTLVARWLS